MRFRRSIVAVVSGALLVSLAAVVPVGAQPRADVVEPVTPSSTLAWTPCADRVGMQCARMDVPMEWTRPNGRTFSLALYRVPARPAPGHTKIGTLFVHPGGPGSSGADLLGLLIQQPMSHRLLRHFDLVAWDPRGIGESTPIPAICRTSYFPTWTPSVGQFAWTDVARQAAGIRAASARACLRVNGGIYRHMGTNEVVQDLDALRSALGDEQLTFLGYSYGTRVGRVYAQRYPSRIRAMLLDGVTGPDNTMFGLMNSSRQGGENGWSGRYAQLRPHTRVLYTKLQKYLQSSEISYYGESYNRWNFWSQALLLSRASGSATAVAQWLCTLAVAADMQQGTCGLPPQSKARVEQSKRSPAIPFVMCADLGGRPTPADIGATLASTSPVAAMNVLEYSTFCSGMPPAWDQIPAATINPLPTPPLLVNGTFDINTPINSARATSRYFPGSRLIAVETSKHGIFLMAGSAQSCVNKTAFRYLISKRLPETNLTCSTA